MKLTVPRMCISPLSLSLTSAQCSFLIWFDLIYCSGCELSHIQKHVCIRAVQTVQAVQCPSFLKLTTVHGTHQVRTTISMIVVTSKNTNILDDFCKS